MIEYVGLTVDGDVLDVDGGLVGNVVVATVCGALCVVGDEPGVDGGVGGNVVGATEGTFCVDGCVGAIVVCPIMGIVVSSGEFAVN